MKLEVALREMFAYPIADILAAMPEEGDPVWAQFALRQTAYPVHKATRSIVLHWRGDGEDGPVFTFDYAPVALRKAVAACGETIRATLGGRLLQLMLTELPAGATVQRHVDGAPALVASHRCHLPVLTNDAVSFMIGGVDHHLEAGSVYEFDNTRPHAVFNRGETRRVHLICDVLP
ncbi:aspartyl/asparaginyl beta-hydroxylase domain-containing protein [Sphingomonas immobilis]|uniref:Aspartyl/asparaginyl beta-hydroxylase domain-containing protein n=1 Tax=Sphingomonas immobilis TaxID=3063997 RepID=A0ABT9A0L8_9SPHN|nr:aspartyl/asparaginyl beta-hydroxylase domain-containing protein [Sphingomonas sp. CA1-15]MDO7842795.1 aspartyl/asparaginyl beta-hydroxylase domain-containing protein [Sphingomonas sp. CA1-15]